MCSRHTNNMQISFWTCHGLSLSMIFFLDGEVLPLSLLTIIFLDSIKYRLCEAFPGFTVPPEKCFSALSLSLCCSILDMFTASVLVFLTVQQVPGGRGLCVSQCSSLAHSTWYITGSHLLFAEWKEKMTTLLRQVLIRQFLEAEAKALHIYTRRALARSRAAESSWVCSHSSKCLPSRLPNPFKVFEKQLAF